MDPLKTEVNTEHVKKEQNVKNVQDYRWEEDVHKTIKYVYFEKQENQVKQDHNEDINKNAIQALKKPYKSYNTDFINNINDKFKNM